MRPQTERMIDVLCRRYGEDRDSIIDLAVSAYYHRTLEVDGGPDPTHSEAEALEKFE